MLYTPSHAELGDHPKMWRVADRLGLSAPATIGHLHLLWYFTLRFAPDGDLSRFRDPELARAAQWPGDAQEFVAALRETGWLDEYRVHDWQDYGGKYIERKRANAERMRVARSANQPTTDDERAAHVQRTSGAHAPLEERRGEERRAEESTTTPTESRGSAAPESAVALVAHEGANGVEVAAQPNGTLKARYSEQYRKAGDQREKADALGGLFREALGAEPTYPRLMAMAKRVGSGGKMIDLIIAASTADITDDPHDYLEKLVQREEEGKSGRTAGARRGAGRGDARRLAGARAYYNGDDRPEDSWSEP